jgi:hypothetical protein
MQLSINSPIAPPVAPTVTQILVTEVHSLLNNNQIYLVWQELDGYSNVINTKAQYLTNTVTSAFFTTPVGFSVILQDVFDAATAAFLATIYGPVTITSP